MIKRWVRDPNKVGVYSSPHAYLSCLFWQAAFSSDGDDTDIDEDGGYRSYFFSSEIVHFHFIVING